MPLWVGSGRGEDTVKELGVRNNECVCGVMSYSLSATEISELLSGRSRYPLQKAKVAAQESDRPGRREFPLRGGMHIGNYLGKGKIWRRR